MKSLKMGVNFAIAIFLLIKGNAEGYVMYNSTTEMCCDGTATATKPDNGVCCGNISISTSEALCCHNQVVPLPEAKPFGYGCCFNTNSSKAVPYNYEKEFCCDGVPMLIDNAVPHGCFHGEVYDLTAFQQCGDQLVARDVNKGCCFDETFDLETKVCCVDMGAGHGHQAITGHHVYDKKDNHHCCGSKYYNATSQVCCGLTTTVIPKPENIDRDAFGMCCNGQAYNPKLQTCCRDKLYDLTANNGCCRDLLYDTSTEICCKSEVFRKDSGKSCCWMAGKSYDPKTDICCYSEVVPLSAVKETNGKTSCCAPTFSSTYN